MLFFFDTSALAKRFQEEPGSATVDLIFDEPSNRIFTSRLGVLELTAVSAIKYRTGFMSAEDVIEFLAAVGESMNSYQFIVQRLLELDFDRAQSICQRKVEMS